MYAASAALAPLLHINIVGIVLSNLLDESSWINSGVSEKTFIAPGTWYPSYSSGDLASMSCTLPLYFSIILESP